ncbi:MAG: class I SAM-dependent methyltransferase [Candidatus Methanofastidiosia archaeon]
MGGSDNKGFVDKVLGDLFHPGGLNLTRELAELVGITEEEEVLDIACMEGDRAIFLTEEFGCKVYGVDLSTEKIKEATKKARKKKLLKRLFFKNADANDLTSAFQDEMFDVVLCELTICLFPNRLRVLREAHRVLKEKGRIIFSGVINRKITPEIKERFSEMTCLFQAPTLKEFKKLFEDAGFRNVEVLDRTDIADLEYKKLREKWRKLRFFSKIFLKNTTVDSESFLSLIREGEELIRQRKVGYAIVYGKK